MLIDKFLDGRFRVLDEAGDDNGGGGAGPQDPPPQDPPPSNPPNDPGDHGGNDDDDPGLKTDHWTDEDRAYIKKLRTQAASERGKKKETLQEMQQLREQFAQLQSGMKKALGIDDESDLDPKQAMAQMQGQLEQYEYQNQVRDFAYENGITSPKQTKYLSFLISEELETLEEGEEIAEDRLAELVSEVKGLGGSGKSSTSVGGKGSDSQTPPPPSDNGSNITAEQFAKMGMAEQGKLHATNPDLYFQLRDEAKKKGIYLQSRMGR